jgi:hypothetical protein
MFWIHRHVGCWFCLALASSAVPAAHAATEPGAPAGDPGALESSCALLDDPRTRSLMDGLLLKLVVQCDRQDLLRDPR